MRRSEGVWVGILVFLIAPGVASAGTLVQLFRNPALGKLESSLEPIGPALASTVASTYPIASASSSVSYVYNPALESFERRTLVLGPAIGERAETVGAGQIDFGLSYSYVRLTSINGDDLSELVNRPLVGGRFIFFSAPGGVTLKDGRFANFLPVRVTTDLDVEAHILTPGITYGITPDLDVNLTVPLIRTALSVTAATDVPDPRFPQFALERGTPVASHPPVSVSDTAEGVGDVLLRAKYVLVRERFVDVAAGLGLSLPTGSVDDFQGTGDTRVQPTLILSRVFADRFQPLLNVGVDLNADRVGRSVVRWAVGATAQVWGPFTAGAVFLGRHELERQAAPIAQPFFFQIERNDIYDASVGLRYRFAESGAITANALVPLNADGLRADVIPTVGIEYAFTAPWSSPR